MRGPKDPTPTLGGGSEAGAVRGLQNVLDEALTWRRLE